LRPDWLAPNPFTNYRSKSDLDAAQEEFVTQFGRKSAVSLTGRIQMTISCDEAAMVFAAVRD
jgi:hypothetical protein